MMEERRSVKEDDGGKEECEGRWDVWRRGGR